MKKKCGNLLIFFCVCLATMVNECDMGIEPSPEPGLLRVTLTADSSETFVVVVKDTFVVAQEDIFGITISQGKVYRDENLAYLYNNMYSYETESTSNILKREQDKYNRYIVYNSYVPPGDYDALEFSITASELKIGNMVIPVSYPSGMNGIKKLEHTFKVKSNVCTEIRLIIKPFSSVMRYRDSYQFLPQIEIESICENVDGE